MTTAKQRLPVGWRRVLTKADTPRPPDLRRIARQIHHFGGFVMRVPALPYVGTSERCFLRADHVVAADTDTAFADERLQLDRLCVDPFVRAAIQIASPSLHEKLLAVDAGGSLPLDVALSALRYIGRMSARCTPFGLFAGVATGRVDVVNALRHPQAEAMVPHMRLDMSVIDEVVAWASQRDVVRKTAVLRANNTFCALNGDNARYVETSRDSGGLVYSLANIEPTPYVTACMGYARDHGGKTARELAEFMTQFDSEVEFDDALEFVLGLVGAQLLIPAIAPAVTSPNALGELIRREDIAAELPVLRELHQVIQSVDGREMCNDSEHAQAGEIDALLSKLPFKTKAGRAVQVDAHFPTADLALSEATIRTICDAVFPYFAVSYRGQSGSLEQFKSEFVKRFGTKEVPLALALDEESGVRFDAYAASPNEGSQRVVEAVLLKRLVEMPSGNDGNEIVLTDDDIVAISAAAPHSLPGTMSVLASLARAEDGVDVHFKCVVAPGGAQLLGRFAFAAPSVEKLVRDMIEFEEASDSKRIFAEIVHVPTGRIGNVICRPVFRRYEIPYVSPASDECEQAIPLSDLTVSVVRNRIVLRSVAHGLEVSPRLSSAHNFLGNNLGIYQFLSSLQHQDGGSFSFGWGRPFDSLDRLPRVRYRNCIFASERWRVTAPFVAKLKAEAKRGSGAALAWLRVERERRGIPRIIQIEERDNALTFDLDSPLSVALLADFVDAQRHPYLVEGLKPEQCIVHDAAGSGYTSEIVLPLRWESERDRQRGEPHRSDVPNIEDETSEPQENLDEIVSPGGEVAYLKIYGGEKSLDNFAARDLQMIWKKLAAGQPNLRMFFVRYYDTGYHLRIRVLHDDAKRLWANIVPALLGEVTSCREKYLFRDIALDTYERETARYGGPQRMAICETIFAFDSLLALDALALHDTTHKDVPRWRYAVVVARFIVESAFASLHEQLLVFDELFVAFADRGGVSREVLKANFAAMHRTRREMVDTILFETPATSSLESALLDRSRDTLSEYRSAIRSLALSSADAQDRSILASIVHMSMNRIFIVNANQEEAIVYYLMIRALESHVARQDRTSSAKSEAPILHAEAI